MHIYGPKLDEFWGINDEFRSINEIWVFLFLFLSPRFLSLALLLVPTWSPLYVYHQVVASDYPASDIVASQASLLAWVQSPQSDLMQNWPPSKIECNWKASSSHNNTVDPTDEREADLSMTVRGEELVTWFGHCGITEEETWRRSQWWNLRLLSDWAFI